MQEMYERKLVDLAQLKEKEKETQRDELQQIINELKALLEEEKQKMGEAGKLREMELLSEIESLKK